MSTNTRSLVIVVLFSLALLGGLSGFAQGLQDKVINVSLKNKPLGDALNAIGKQGHFYFSYNSNIIKKDSLVSLSAQNVTVRKALSTLLGENYQYKETENHIIILPIDKEKWYTISGYITDAETGQRVADASVFERQQLVATLTDPGGYFKLRIKDRGRPAATQITVSKGFYQDTSIAIDKGYDQEIALTITPAEHTLPDIVITQYSKMEQTWIGKLLFSNSLRKQSLNLQRFFIDEPIQFSLIPGLGTHGKMSSQVVNEFSFNAFGGYSAGVDGLELGGIFNIDKKDVQYLQLAGIFNIVSGGVKGVQIGGWVNKVSKSVSGVQISGIANHVGDSLEGVVLSGISSYIGGSLSGVQISGVANLIKNRDSVHRKTDTIPDAMHGVQIAGVVNVVNGHSRGLQLAGVANINRGDIQGVQTSGFVNIAKKVTGSQISFINISDTVSGYCFGILNIVKHGYHILALSSNEMLAYNAVYKAGNSKLYSILGGGMNNSSSKRIYAMEYGIGKEIQLGKKVSIATEVTANHFYPSSQKLNIVVIRFDPCLNVKVHKKLSIYAGPSVAFCPATQGIITDYFPTGVPAGRLYNVDMGGGTTAAWIGWKAGVNIF